MENNQSPNNNVQQPTPTPASSSINSESNITASPPAYPSSIDVNSKSSTSESKLKHLFDFKNLKWYEYLAILPFFILLVRGGAIGGGLGVLGWGLTLKVSRNDNYSKGKKIILGLGIIIGSFIVYFIGAMVFATIINSTFQQ